MTGAGNMQVLYHLPITGVVYFEIQDKVLGVIQDLAVPGLLQES